MHQIHMLLICRIKSKSYDFLDMRMKYLERRIEIFLCLHKNMNLKHFFLKLIKQNILYFE